MHKSVAETVLGPSRGEQRDYSKDFIFERVGRHPWDEYNPQIATVFAWPISSGSDAYQVVVPSGRSANPMRLLRRPRRLASRQEDRPNDRCFQLDSPDRAGTRAGREPAALSAHPGDLGRVRVRSDREGTHARSGLKHLQFGSMAEEVVLRVRRPRDGREGPGRSAGVPRPQPPPK